MTILLVASTALPAVAFVDHERKKDAIRVAYVDSWYCAHRGSRCGRRTPRSVERSWNRREKTYAVGEAGLLASLALGGSLRLLRRRPRASLAGTWQTPR